MIERYIELSDFEFDFIKNNINSDFVHKLHYANTNEGLHFYHDKTKTTLCILYMFNTRLKNTINKHHERKPFDVDMFIANNDYRFQIESLYTHDELKKIISRIFFDRYLDTTDIQEILLCGDIEERIKIYKILS